MAAVDTIIDYCLKALDEADVDSPVQMTRAEVLELINTCYQDDVGPRLKTIATYSYDASDAAHTITAGVGTLPSDFLDMHRIYDGDAPTDTPLTYINSIDDKVEDTADTQQYMLPDLANLWIFGKTPSSTIKIYYYKKPTALTDSSASTPTALKAKFHIGVKSIFATAVKIEYARRLNNTYDEMDEMAKYQDLLDAIELDHGIGKRDDSQWTKTDAMGW